MFERFEFQMIFLLGIGHQVKKQSVKCFPGEVLWCKGKYDIIFLAAAYGLEAGLGQPLYVAELYENWIRV